MALESWIILACVGVNSYESFDIRFRKSCSENVYCLFLVDDINDLSHQISVLQLTVKKNTIAINQLKEKNKEQDDKIKELEDKQVDLPGEGKSKI